MKIDITASQIMDKSFPIIDVSATIIEAIKRIDKAHEAAIVMKHGKFYNIIDEDDIIRNVFSKDLTMNLTDKIEDISIEKHFGVVPPEEDIRGIIEIMKEGDIEFLLVRDKNRILGVISRNELIEAQEDIIEEIDDINSIELENPSLIKCKKCLFRNAEFVVGEENVCKECI